jgi:hypothetical protein
VYLEKALRLTFALQSSLAAAQLIERGKNNASFNLKRRTGNGPDGARQRF